MQRAAHSSVSAVGSWCQYPQQRCERTWKECVWHATTQGFNMQAQGPWFWIEGIIDIFFYIDLVLNFFTAYEVR